MKMFNFLCNDFSPISEKRLRDLRYGVENAFTRHFQNLRDPKVSQFKIIKNTGVRLENMLYKIQHELQNSIPIDSGEDKMYMLHRLPNWIDYIKRFNDFWRPINLEYFNDHLISDNLISYLEHFGYNGKELKGEELNTSLMFTILVNEKYKSHFMAGGFIYDK